MSAATIAASLAAPSADQPTALQGSYRGILAVADLARAGVPAPGRADDAGTWTLTFAGRRWTLRQRRGRHDVAVDAGVIALTKDHVGFTLLTSDGAPHRVFLGNLRWKIAADGTLRLTLLADQFPTSIVSVLTARPWRRTFR